MLQTITDFFTEFNKNISTEFAPAMMGMLDSGLMRVSGADAETFLQGQFTNDISQATDSHHQLSAYCTHKGRIQANFRVCRYNGDYLLQMPKPILDKLIKRLPMFVMRSQVEITDASDDLVQLSFAGGNVSEILDSLFVQQLPQNAGDSYCAEDITILKVAGTIDRFLVITSQHKAEILINTLAMRAKPLSNSQWQLLDIRAGIPTVEESTFENFVPQMINMQLIDGVSFTKGCYIGQEVVARLKYLGKTKRQMYLAKTESDACPAPGTPLFSPDSSSGQGAGSVVNSQPSPTGGCEMLVVSEITGVERNNVKLENADGADVEFLELPYAFEE